MEIVHIPSSSLKANIWSGGKTTQLYIFPSGASYQERNFRFRISTATVESEKSEFTQLDGYWRHLMILEGELFLEHENYHSLQLRKFECAEFDGSWKTTSLGKCTDFNLMTDIDTAGSLKAISIEKTQTAKYNISDSPEFLLIYQYYGKLDISLNPGNATIHQGDMLVISKPTNLSLELYAHEDCELILAEIFWRKK